MCVCKHAPGHVFAERIHVFRARVEKLALEHLSESSLGPIHASFGIPKKFSHVVHHVQTAIVRVTLRWDLKADLINAGKPTSNPSHLHR